MHLDTGSTQEGGLPKEFWEGAEGLEAWKAGEGQGSGAVMVIMADVCCVQTEPHAAPSLVSPRSYSERSGRCHFS